MPAVIDADDSTKPLDDDAVDYPASQGAGEFRALKAKINEAFLLSGVGANSEFMITMNGKSWYSSVTGTPAVIAAMYGHSSNITRTGGTQSTVGAQFQAFLANGVAGTDGVFGVIGSAIHGDTGSSGPLTGMIAQIYARDHNNVAALHGLTVGFGNRLAATPTSGLGNNKYNNNSQAIYITSLQRSVDGEYCGWSNGIVFDEYSMDQKFGGIRGACIDTYALHYDAGGLPSTDYRVDAALRMAIGQSILWDTAGGKYRITGGTIYGPMIAFWQNDTIRFGVTMNTGAVFVAQFAGAGDRAVRVGNDGILYAV
jgi:hypothetical protein